jgi:two-component system cell cycle sensor histidine kinase/response regulator CckA
MCDFDPTLPLRHPALVEHALEAIVVIQDGILVFANREAGALVGQEPADLLGRRLLDFIPPGDHASTNALLEGRQDGTLDGVPLVRRLAHADGSIKRVRGRGVAVQWEGRPAVLSYVLDVTHEHDLQGSLDVARRALERTEAVANVGRLMSGVVHDLNNMYSALELMCGTLAASFDGDDPRSEDVDIIQMVTRDAADLTRRVLSVASSGEESARELDLNREIRRNERLISHLVGPGSTLELFLDERSPRVRIDPLQLTQVLVNLVANAADAMPEGGRLSVGTEAVVAVSGGVALVVRDTGCGMDPALEGRIFEPFFSTKGSETGIGLGLTTVQEIVALAGGRIQVESAPGCGTTVRVVLPSVGGVLPTGPPGDTEIRVLGRFYAK